MSRPFKVSAAALLLAALGAAGVSVATPAAADPLSQICVGSIQVGVGPVESPPTPVICVPAP